MRQRLFPRALVAVVLAAGVAPLATSAQVREVVAKQVSVGQNEASLSLGVLGPKHAGGQPPERYRLHRRRAGRLVRAGRRAGHRVA